MDDHRFALSLTLDEGHAFTVRFDDPALPPLRVDEPPPLGAGSGPNPSRLLGAAIAGCLGSSLLFCLRKSRVEVHGLRADVEGTLTRNEHGRLRVERVRVRLAPTIAEADRDRLARCLGLYEDFCIITESVRRGVVVDVEVVPEVASEVAPQIASEVAP
jgi:uncharacterized OsmC-like protein